MTTLKVKVIEAKNLKAADIGGTSDPYAEVRIKGELAKKTKTIKKTLNPRWNEEFTLKVKSNNDYLSIKVYDYDFIGSNDFLGEIELPIARWFNQYPKQEWLPLQEKKSGTFYKGKGDILIEVSYGTPMNNSTVNTSTLPYASQNSSQQIYPNLPSQQTTYPPPSSGSNFQTNIHQPSNPPSYAPGSQAPPAYPPGSQAPPAYPPSNNSYTLPPGSQHPPGNYPPPTAPSYQNPPQYPGAPGQSPQYPPQYPSQTSQQPPSSSYYPPPGSQRAPGYPPQYPPQSSYAPPHSQHPPSGYPSQYPSYPGAPQYPSGPSPYGPPAPYGNPTYAPVTAGIQASSLIQRAMHSNQGPQLHFFNDIRSHAARDYTLIVDRSGSMASMDRPGITRWSEACEAVSYLAPHICQADPDGVTLLLFSSSFNEFGNIRDPEMVKSIFRQYTPGGSTDLGKVLGHAFARHFQTNRPETILVITDGQPDDQSDVARRIVDASRRLYRDEDLSISFIQIGNDHGAKKFLKWLDDDLRRQGAKFDIVDTVTIDEMRGLSFCDLITKSIVD